MKKVQWAFAYIYFDPGTKLAANLRYSALMDG
jgi:hypothetical protein